MVPVASVTVFTPLQHVTVAEGKTRLPLNVPAVLELERVAVAVALLPVSEIVRGPAITFPPETVPASPEREVCILQGQQHSVPPPPPFNVVTELLPTQSPLSPLPARCTRMVSVIL